MLKKYIIALLVLCFCNVVCAQSIKSFTPDSVKFLEEIETLLGDLKKKEAKEFVKSFEPVWFGGYFTEEQRLKVYQTANTMLAKKLRPWPDFHDYLFSLQSFIQSDQSEESFNVWMSTIAQLVNGKNKKKFAQYIGFCSNLFADNNLYVSISTVWQSSSSNYYFYFEKDEPYIKFKNINLRCFAKGDSMVIYNTSGTYYPLTLKWKATGGKISWIKAGLDENETYAVFDHPYELGLKSANIVIDSVQFYNTYFSKPLLGKITDKALSANTNVTKATYPRFESYNKRLIINNIVEDVDYDGGFTMEGSKFIGAGTNEDLARLTFYRNDKAFIVSKALVYYIYPDRIAATNAQITMYIARDKTLDSIEHPNVELKFIKEEKKLTLIRGDEGTGRSPFFNSYHKIDMYFEAMTWNMIDQFINFGPLFQSSATTATFESEDYYTQKRFNDLFGLDQVHILVVIRDLTKELESNEFYVSSLVKAMKKPESQVKQVLLTLNNLGYLYYDVEQEHVFCKDKLYQHVLARSAKTDYDILQFNSDIKNSTENHNAKLNLMNYDLVIEGVKKVMISDTQKVAIYPKDGRIVLQKNRDFSCGGIVNAGQVQIKGNDFVFTYDDFKINLIDVEFIVMGAKEFGNYKGHRPLKMITTYIEGVKGFLLVDNQFNKSGLDTSFHQYPVLTTTGESYAYYDYGKYGSVYNRDEFYFKLDTFTMDSLDGFTNEGISFDGEFVSAGIFPKFREKLRLMPDYSLGFVRETPNSGFTMYGDKGEFNNKIGLSNNGLQGDGRIDFLTSTSVSDAFTFFPDSTLGIAQTFDNIEQSKSPEIPRVTGREIYIKYIPKEKVLYASKVDSTLHFFNNQAELYGTLALRAQGMTGKGSMRFSGARLTSYEFRYKKEIIDSDTAAFSLSSYDLNALAFKTENVNAHVDFSERMGEFKSNGEESFVSFPENQYICYMDQFKWFMDKDELELAHSGKQEIYIDSDLSLAGSNFYSTHPDQDSLNFMAPKAMYSLKNKLITCKEIPFIKVADVLVFPDSNRVVIHKKAKMETLTNALIEANATTRYHKLFNAIVDIHSKNDYFASADYVYVDENKMEQTVHFSSIVPDSTKQTYAEGSILETDKFMLSPNFEFIGKMKLEASRHYMVFDGATRIIHDCEGITKNWMNFVEEIDPNNIFIPVGADLMDQENNPIGAGIIMNTDSIGLYSTFLSRKNGENNLDVISASGYLYYDKKSKEYQISNKEKLIEHNLPGNFISLNTQSCVVSGEGNFEFGVNLDQVEINEIGILTHDLNSNKVDIDATMSINFPFNDNALKLMVAKIVDYPELQAFDIEKSHYETSLRELIGLEKTDQVISDLTLKGKIKKMPDELQTTLFLGDIHFKWNEKESAYRSYGAIGITNIKKEQIFANLKGNIEIAKTRTGDAITIYLELDADDWWFFTYSKGIMQVLSSDKEFVTVIQETKPDDRKTKGDKGIANYQYMLASSKAKKDKFLRKFEE